VESVVDNLSPFDVAVPATAKLSRWYGDVEGVFDNLSPFDLGVESVFVAVCLSPVHPFDRRGAPVEPSNMAHDK